MKARRRFSDGGKSKNKIKYFSLLDNDVNYLVKSSDFQADITGDNDGCIFSISDCLNLTPTIVYKDDSENITVIEGCFESNKIILKFDKTETHRDMLILFLTIGFNINKKAFFDSNGFLYAYNNPVNDTRTEEERKIYYKIIDYLRNNIVRYNFIKNGQQDYVNIIGLDELKKNFNSFGVSYVGYDSLIPNSSLFIEESFLNNIQDTEETIIQSCDSCGQDTSYSFDSFKSVIFNTLNYPQLRTLGFNSPLVLQFFIRFVGDNPIIEFNPITTASVLNLDGSITETQVNPPSTFNQNSPLNFGTPVQIFGNIQNGNLISPYTLSSNRNTIRSGFLLSFGSYFLKPVNLTSTDIFVNNLWGDKEKTAYFRLDLLNNALSDNQYDNSFGLLITKNKIEKNRWYHITIVNGTLDGKMKLYIDGDFQTETNAVIVPQPDVNTVSNFSINRFYDTITQGSLRPIVIRRNFLDTYFEMDKLKIYNTLLTDNEIKAASICGDVSTKPFLDVDFRNNSSFVQGLGGSRFISRVIERNQVLISLL
jgi:hypothetical protein